MAAFLLRRLAAAVVLVFLVLTATFFVVHLVPGDPTTLFEDPRIPREHQLALRELYGLDRPLAEQYGRWLRSVLAGDWGRSLAHQRPASAVIADALPATLLLTGSALALQFVLGLGLGVAAARRRGARVDRWIGSAALVLYALPTFWLAILSIVVFSHWLPLFPAGQMRSVGAESWGPVASALDRLRHLALPVLVLGLSSAAGIARQARAGLLDVLGEEYIRTARAKGVPEGRVLWVHALRNALGPLIQLLGLSLPFLLSGALVIEVVFGWPGMGRITYDAILARDLPLILAGTALAAILVVAGNLVADILQSWADPRLRHAD